MNVAEFNESLDYLVAANLTPFIWGHAGIGKSSLVSQYAKKKGYHFFPFYLGTQSDLGDILGLQDFIRDANGTAKATTFATPEWLRNTIDYCNANPDSGAIIFLDEFNRARRDILNGMFSLALDKTFHTLKLPDNCHVIAAGNPPTDEYFTTDVDETALMARFVHIKLEPSVDEWLQYAVKSGHEPTLVEFIRQQPDLLEAKRSNFSLPVKVDRRAYERLSRLFKLNTPPHILEHLMLGIIGAERTVAYKQFMISSEKPLTGDEVLSGSKIHAVKQWSKPENIMASFLNLTCDNLKVTLTKLDKEGKTLLSDQKRHLFEFFMAAPKDVLFPLLKHLVDSRMPLFKNFYLDESYEMPMVELVQSVRGTK
jgi:hypothetical protein